MDSMLNAIATVIWAGVALLNAAQAPLIRDIGPGDPVPRVLRYGDWQAVQHFPAAEQRRAAQVQWCETRDSPDPDHEIGLAGEVGRFQIHPIHVGLHQRYDLNDPEQNGLAALELWTMEGWNPWSCRP